MVGTSMVYPDDLRLLCMGAEVAVAPRFLHDTAAAHRANWVVC